MRLLNRKTLQLETFPDEPYPAFAILSHRWSDTEMTIQDMQGGRASLQAEGYKKMKMMCRQAKVDGIDYIWIDTFCIDKESSAELSEAINSMFAWYRRAKVCYAFMADVACKDDGWKDDGFDKSVWFERGWTLQELIAPKEVVFYSKKWKEIGTRSNMASRLSRITKIDEGVLTGVTELRYVSLATRMSWAADRKTTRQEDIAYCLAGLFDVNIATLYGEGSEKAFRRLQEEIMKDSDDESLFAWKNEQKDPNRLQGLLATSPADFRNSSRYIPGYGNGIRTPASTTGRGLCISLSMQLLKDDIWVGALRCPVPPEYTQMLAIYLKLLDKSSQQYARVRADTLCKIPQCGPLQTIYVRQKPHIPGFDDVYLHHAFQLRRIEIRREGETGAIALSSDSYSLLHTETNLLCGAIEPLPTSTQRGVPALTFEMPRANARLAGLLALARPDDTVAVVLLGSRPGIGPGVHIFSDGSSKPARCRFGRLMEKGTKWMSASQELQSQATNECCHLQAPGTLFSFDQDNIHVNITTQCHAGIRYYMVDIMVTLPRVLDIGDIAPVIGMNAQRTELRIPL
jgi:hypothetical protein